MIGRMQRIQDEFGSSVVVRLRLLQFGLIIMSIGGWIGLSSLLPATAALLGLLACWALRERIVRMAEWVPLIVKIGLAIYGGTLVISDEFQWSHVTQLTIISATTALILSLQFWSRSDARVIADNDGDTVTTG